MTRWYL